VAAAAVDATRGEVLAGPDHHLHPL